MADEQAQAEQDPTAEAEQPDYKALYEQAKAHSREWERKAKANRGAAEELEQLKSAQMSEVDKARKEAEDARSELAELRAERERADAASRVAAETGVPLELLGADLSTEEGMRAFARAWREHAKLPSAPRVPSAGAFAQGPAAGGDPVRDFAKAMDFFWKR